MTRIVRLRAKRCENGEDGDEHDGPAVAAETPFESERVRVAVTERIGERWARHARGVACRARLVLVTTPPSALLRFTALTTGLGALGRQHPREANDHPVISSSSRSIVARERAQ